MKPVTLPEAAEVPRARTFKRAQGLRRQSTRDRIRELWPIVRLLRREGYSWRQLPAYFQAFYGLPRSSHVSFIVIGREMGDIVYTPRKPLAPSSRLDRASQSATKSKPYSPCEMICDGRAD